MKRQGKQLENQKTAASQSFNKHAGKQTLDELIQERAQWIETLEHPDRHQLLFQIETYLVALDRFLRPGDLALLSSGDGTDGFKKEMEVTVRVLKKTLSLVRQFRPEEDTQAALFGRFVEQALLTDGRRDLHLKDKKSQATPDLSFVQLDSTIEHMVHLGNGLLQAPQINSATFFSFGVLLKSQLYTNLHFNPFAQRGFSETYDRIDHSLIVRAIRQLEDEAARRAIAMVILSCMRVSRYLGMIHLNATDIKDLRDNLPLFALIQSDLQAITPIFKQTVPAILEDAKDAKLAEQIRELLEALSFQFNMEGNKVFNHVLREASGLHKREHLLNAVETAHGILSNFVQQSVVWVVQTLVPDVQGRDLFHDFVSRQEQSVRLREDIWILARLVQIANDQIDEAANSPKTREIVRSLNDYLDYFQSFAIKQVRASDLEAFQQLCESFQEIVELDLSNEEIQESVLQEFHRHHVFLDTTLQCINQRSDLQGISINSDHAGNILRQFLPQSFVQ